MEEDSASSSVCKMDKFIKYLETVGAIYSTLPSDIEKAAAAQEQLLDSFINDSTVRVLQISTSSDEDVISPEAENRVVFSLQVSCLEYNGEENREKESQRVSTNALNTILLTKKLHVSTISADFSITSQLQMITFSSDNLVSSSSNTDNSENKKPNTNNNSLENASISELYTYIQQSFTPMLNSYASAVTKKSGLTSHHNNTSTTGNNSSSTEKGRIGLPVVRKKMKELELALLQYQQNLDIPDVCLPIHPVIQAAANDLKDDGGKIDNMEALGLSPYLSDDKFLNTVQSGVNRWIKEIQQVTRLGSSTTCTSALSEINFYKSLGQALEKVEQLLQSPEVLLTLNLLRQAKRYLVTVTFEADHGLSTAMKRVSNVMMVMKDLPINALLSATDVQACNSAITSIFTHLKKVKTADQYELSRVMKLVEALSRDLCTQLSTIFASQHLIASQYSAFVTATSCTTSLFESWDNQLKVFYDLVRDLSRRRGTASVDPVMPFNELVLEHKGLEARIKSIVEFRMQHEKLRSVLSKVNKQSGGTASASISDIQAAYDQFKSISVLDTSDAGSVVWTDNRRAYDMCVDRVEGGIISILTERLKATSSADEMFRVFSRFNVLFFRPRVRAAVQSFQMQLIESVKKDVEALQVKFKASYATSEAAIMSTVRDIPPISGAIYWARTIERRLDTYVNRVENVLGAGWEQHVEGKALKSVADSFRRKLNTNVIFDKWVAQLANIPSFEVSGSIFQIVSVKSDDGSKRVRQLEVAFDPQIITLFKEVRNLEKMFRVPYSIKMIAAEAKEKYPFAVALQSSLRTFSQTSAKMRPEFRILLSDTVHDVHDTIAKALGGSGRRRITWDSDSLSTYVQTLSKFITTYQEKMDDLIVKNREITDILTSSLSKCPYSSKEFKSALGSVQEIVDALNLVGYSNITKWVSELNSRIEDILVQRLGDAIAEWISCFSDENKVLKPSVHQIVLRDQTLFMEPSVECCRSFWISEFQRIISTVCDLEVLTGTSFDAAFRTGEEDKASRRQTFHRAFNRLSTSSVAKSYGEIERQLNSVEEYVDTWLQYQALWDMDSQNVVSKLGEDDISKWMQLLLEIKHERSNFDNYDKSKCYGPIVIEYQQVQTQVSLKYDAWAKELLGIFADVLGSEVGKFYQKISSLRSQLEVFTLEAAATAKVVTAVTVIQDTSASVDEWKKDLDVFSNAERLLKRQRYKFREDWPCISNVEGEWDAFQQILSRKVAAMKTQLPQLQTKILAESDALQKRIKSTVCEWNDTKPSNDDESYSKCPKEVLEGIVIFETRIRGLLEEYEQVGAAKTSLELKNTDGADVTSSIVNYTNLEAAAEELVGLKEVWVACTESWNRLEELKETLWTVVQPRKVRKELEAELDRLKALPSRIRQYDAYENVVETVKGYKKINAMVVDLKTDALKDRHWKSILSTLELSHLPLSQLTLGHLWKSKLLKRNKELKDVVREAQGEMALEEFLRQVREYWTNYSLDLVNYQNRCRLIRGWDEFFNKLDEHLSSLSSMKQSPFYRVFTEECLLWENRLTSVRSLFDFWIDVQRRWVYLEGIFFGSADIKQQLPKEHARFKSVDNEFVSTMRKISSKPTILDVAALPNLQSSLERQDDMMAKIQRALGEYLERQRAAFSRFYFVGDEDLLEIIGNSKDPVKIQRHMSKLFAGISSLQLDSDNQHVITGMASREGEVVTFCESINVEVDSRVNVWLEKAEHQMRFTLATLLQKALTGIRELDIYNAAEASSSDKSTVEKYLSWVKQYPAQIVILSTQVHWSELMEASMSSESVALSSISETLERVLTVLANCVLNDLPNDLRKKYEQLITEVVHERDVTRSLSADEESVTVNDFKWLYHMRYYWNPEEADIMKKLKIQMANATFYYGFEYLGVGERLVQTPLTDKCYLTLTQALHFRMGGNPFGPAGTGKTETVKALGAQLGRFVLVFNCDENFDFQAMGRIFLGLCQVGAWGCFDEFNRLEERVLSAVSQQILTIQAGLSSHSNSIELLSKAVELHDDVGIFVTMNPGYAGRSNLPDNLKQLFRGIAMVAPDRELIAQVMLFSQGIISAEELSQQVVLLFQLCQDQLSTQPHYDFGLRALKSVLVSAGSLKRQSRVANSSQNEEQAEVHVLIKSICGTIVPKLVSSDLLIFKTLLTGVFPNQSSNLASLISGDNCDALRSKVLDVATEQHFVVNEDGSDLWLEKVLQLHQVLQLRHGVMLVGPSGVGKSSARSTLLASMEALDGVKGESYVIDPKALSKEDLYGVLDPTTLEWTDGVFTLILRTILNNVRGEAQKRHWIIFDGDVDPEWAENLNSVLDDNKLLTLPSGERLAIPSNVSILMETESLRYATLATVSRCGMVWFSDQTLPLVDILSHHLKDFSTTASMAIEDSTEVSRSRITSIVAQCLEPFCLQDGVIIATLRHVIDTCAGTHIMNDVSPIGCLVSLFSLLNGGLDQIMDFNTRHPDFPLSEEKHIATFVSNYLMYCLLWAFGASMNNANRVLLSQFVENDVLPTEISSNLPSPLVDYEVNILSSDAIEWRAWNESVPTIDLESHRVLSTDVVVSTVDTVRHVAVLRSWLSQHVPLILCGPPGSGKSMILASTLTACPEYTFATLNFSSGTTPELILKTFSQYCKVSRESNGNHVMTPLLPEKWLVIFCDEINLPASDTYGTTRVITFLRQIVESGGFWRGRDNVWITLRRVQFVGACNPPTDPGRVPLSSRFLRHAPVLFVDFPSPQSLRTIYKTFNRAFLKLVPALKTFEEPLTDVMVSTYEANQQRFVATTHPHYIYSPRELSRWMRALYEAIEPLDETSVDVKDLVKTVLHEGLRLFSDRLVTEDERAWCETQLKETIVSNFPNIDPLVAFQSEDDDEGGNSPILFSNWLSKTYVQVSRASLREHIQARLRVFYEEELDVPLVVFDEVIDHVLRIDRVLRQPLGHLLLVGASGAGKTVLTKFVAWMNGMSVFQIKVTRSYCITDFDDDLRRVLYRAGVDGERICFIFDESNVLQTSFLERMNSLLASGEVPGLYEGEEYVSLMHSCAEAAAKDGIMVDTQEELFRHFTRQIQRNLHVVFTMNPANSDFENRSSTSPALFNRCVVDWFGTWSDVALAQVALEFTLTLDFEHSSYSAPANRPQLHQYTSANVDEMSYRDAAVYCFVKIHHSVVDTMTSLQKRHLTFNSISPRDYLDFIKHYVAIFKEKKTQLEEQQLHLNVGLDKLRETEVEVASLRSSLSTKKEALRKKDTEANEKLAQMVKDQNEAEQKKAAAEALTADLDAQEKEIQERQGVVQSDLAKAEPALIDAKNSVGSIRKSQLDEIRALARPPAAVRMTMEAVATLLGEKSLDWADLRKFIRKDDFISLVVKFESDKITDKTRRVIQEKYLSSEDFKYEKVHRASKPCGPLFKWIVSQLDYSQILGSIAPLRKEVTTLQDALKQLRETYTELQETIVALEDRIATYKREYAALIQDAQTIKLEMNTVQQKVDRSHSLLESLSIEKTRWEESSQDFQSQMATVVGDALVAAAFLTYSGFLDQKQRQVLLQDWRDVLDEAGVEYNVALSISEYLCRPQDRVKWAANSLPSDELCVENAIILQRYNRFPLIIDPSGQATTFIMKQYSDRKISKTSFLDASFMKVLASAIRFGTPLLVQDVETIDPILNPVLNRELHKTGGRVLIRLGGEEIDYSPEFTLFLTTRDPSVRFTPDLSSRVTFVNFTITPASLQHQALSLILQREKPELDSRRKALVQQQGEFQAKLRDLEEALLDEINKVTGNILDDDRAILALEKMKADGTELHSLMAETESVISQVEDATGSYQSLARACALSYFCCEKMSDIHFLYQFSLKSFLSILESVLESLETTTTSSDENVRITALMKNFFDQIGYHVSRALQYEDKLTFALRLSQIATSVPEWKDETCSEVPTEDEMEYLLTGALRVPSLAIMEKRAVYTELVAAFPSKDCATASQLANLSHLFSIEDMSDLRSSVAKHKDVYDHILTSPTTEMSLENFEFDVVGDSSPRKLFRELLLMTALRPDRIIISTEKFLQSVFQNFSAWRHEKIDLEHLVSKESSAEAPLLLCSKSGYDPSSQVDALASLKNKKLASVAMGSAEGYEVAEKSIYSAAKKGTWVLLRNIHLCPAWLQTLEKNLYALTSRATDFRLFLTSEIHPKLPVNLLRSCQIVVFESPVGVQESLIRSFDEISEERMSRAPVERGKLYFLLCWFRAIVQERLRYVPVGWSKSYEFGSSADQKCALDVIDYWVDKASSRSMSHLAPESIPWDAIKTILSDSIFGGRIDNDFDQALMSALLSQLFVPSSCTTDSSAFGLVSKWDGTQMQTLVKNVDGKNKQEFMDWILSLPKVNSPEWLGLPHSAETMLSTQQGLCVLQSFTKLQDLFEGVENSTEEVVVSTTTTLSTTPAWISSLVKKVEGWKSMLLVSLSEAKTDSTSSVSRCMNREVSACQKLLHNIKASLDEVSAIATGESKATNDTRLLMRELSRDIVPNEWKGAYPVQETLGASCHAWMLDFAKRLEHFTSQSSSSTPLWLGGLFCPEAFVTSTRQAAATSYECSLGDLVLQLASSANDNDDELCFAIDGLVMQGATWSEAGLEMTDQISSIMPTMYMKWKQKALQDNTQLLTIPVYLNSDRASILFTVDIIVANTKIPHSVLHQRAIAITLWNNK